MKKKDLLIRAVGEISENHIEETLAFNENPTHLKKKRAWTMPVWAPFAACMAVIMGFAALTLNGFFSGDNSLGPNNVTLHPGNSSEQTPTSEITATPSETGTDSPDGIEHTVDISDLLVVNYDFHLYMDYFADKIPIVYGENSTESKRIIIYGKAGNVSNLTLLNLDLEDGENYDEIFSFSYGYPTGYYIEYYTDMPLEELNLVIEFREFRDVYRSYLLQHNYETGSIDLVKWGRDVEPNGTMVDDRFVHSPGGRVARLIGGNLSTHRGFEVFVDDKKIEVDDERRIDFGYVEIDVIWLDDDILLIVFGNAQGSVAQGGDIYYYDLRAGSNGLVITHKAGYYTEANHLSFDDNQLEFYTYQHFDGASYYFKSKSEPITKERIYELIQAGEVITFDVNANLYYEEKGDGR